MAITYSPGQLVFEWVSNPVNDMIADSALAVVLQLEANPLIYEGKVKQEAAGHLEIKQVKLEPGDSTGFKLENEQQRLTHIKDLLTAQYGERIVSDEDTKQVTVSVDDEYAVIDLLTLTGECNNAALKERVAAILNRVKLAVYPIPST